MPEDAWVKEYKSNVLAELRADLLELQAEGWFDLSDIEDQVFSPKDAARACRLLMKLQVITRRAAFLLVNEDFEIEPFPVGRLHSFTWALAKQFRCLSVGVEAPGFTLPPYAKQNKRTAHPAVTLLAMEIAAAYRALSAANCTDNAAFKLIASTLEEFGIGGHSVSTIRSRCLFYAEYADLPTSVADRLKLDCTPPYTVAEILGVFKRVISDEIIPDFPDDLFINKGLSN